MSAVILDSDILHYEVLGRGKPILFLHGWAGSWRYWVPTMQAVSSGFRTYALDFWGFGDSSKNAKYNIADQVNLIDQFMMEMGMMKLALVGHGLGAVAAIQFALRFPNRVDRVMAVANPLSSQGVKSRLKSAESVALVDWLLGSGPGTEVVRADAPKNDPMAVERSLDNLGSINLNDAWHQLKTNCLLVHGQNDPAIIPPSPDQFGELPEHMHAITLENSGHFPMLDESSRFNRLLTDFLTLGSGESPRQLQLKEEWKRRVR